MTRRRGSAPRSPNPLLGSALALGAGAAIAWLDTRPGWDDAGITAVALAIAGAASSLSGIPPWLGGALVVAPILFAERSVGAGVLLAIPFALAGAFAGAWFRRLTRG